jgi:hypothetical protein
MVPNTNQNTRALVVFESLGDSKLLQTMVELNLWCFSAGQSFNLFCSNAGQSVSVCWRRVPPIQMFIGTLHTPGLSLCLSGLFWSVSRANSRSCMLAHRAFRMPQPKGHGSCWASEFVPDLVTSHCQARQPT